MLYHWYEFGHAALRPARAAADSCKLLFSNPLNPFSHTAFGRSAAAACEVFERTTRRYVKPGFGIYETTVNGRPYSISEEVMWQKSFCHLINFRKYSDGVKTPKQSKLLLVAPMSGHYATLLRGTVQDMLPNHDIYITDWQDARTVPEAVGHFDLNSYIDYMIELFELFEGDIHVMGVCQPAVPIMAAVSVMEASGNANVPHSMILLGGPIDTRINQTAVNNLAEKKGIDWFERNVITTVPWPNAGHGRRVYPGFLQLTGFMTMNLDRHVTAHKDFFWHLVQGDGDSAEKHKDFYDEYLAVMDLTAEFYLQTVDTVFARHLLPKGLMKHYDRPVDPSAIKNVAMLTIEGEKDDISGVGQCEAAHALCKNLPESKKEHYVQLGVGHYGIFNGSRFRKEIAPKISSFIAEHHNKSKIAEKELAPIEKNGAEPSSDKNRNGKKVENKKQSDYDNMA